MFYDVTGFLFTVFAHAVLVVGFAVLLLQKRDSVDYSSVLPFTSVALIPLGLLALYAYGTEAFISYYGANQYEGDTMSLRMFGPYSAVYLLDLIGVVSTQVFWIPKLRKSAIACLVVGLLNLFA